VEGKGRGRKGSWKEGVVEGRGRGRKGGVLVLWKGKDKRNVGKRSYSL